VRDEASLENQGEGKGHFVYLCIYLFISTLCVRH
jgi:hypothetical protein